MIGKEYLTQEYINLVKSYYPETGQLIDRCYVKVIDGYIARLHKNFYYIGIYYPEKLLNYFLKHENAFKEIAENMGLLGVVFINTNRLIKDPMLRIKQEDPRFWLEIYWIATQDH